MAFKITREHVKAVWWVRMALRVAVLTVVVAVVVQATRSDTTTNVSNTIFNFFNDWAFTLAAAATVLLAIGAFLQILDQRHARQMEMQMILRKEIVAWVAAVRDTLATPPDFTDDMAVLEWNMRQATPLVQTALHLARAVSMVDSALGSIVLRGGTLLNELKDMLDAPQFGGPPPDPRLVSDFIGTIITHMGHVDRQLINL